MSAGEVNPDPASVRTSSGSQPRWARLRQWSESEVIRGLKRTGRWIRWALSESISARIALLCALANSILLLAAGVSLDYVLQRSLQEDDEIFVREEIGEISTLMGAHLGEREFLQRIADLEGAARRHGRYYVRIFDAKGGIFIQSPNMTNFPAPVDFPRLAQAASPIIGTRWVSPENKRVYVLGSARSDFSWSGRRPLIQVAVDVTEEKAMMARFRAWGACVLALGIGASVGAGWWIARRSLQPLVEISRRAQSVSAAHLNARIGVVPWPEELIALAQEFDRMLERLEDSFTRLSQFSADLAHELRTPINNLVLGTDVALGQGRTADEYRTVLESSREEYGRLSRMIDSLLFLARADNAEMQVNRAAMDARKIVASVVEFFQPLAEDKRVSLTMATVTAAKRGNAVTALTPVWLNADTILFRRAINNLVSNAVHYTPPGGKVEVQIEVKTEGQTEIRVVDTGCGIPREHQAKIFDRFYRVDPARSRDQEGTGLGLAIVKSIATLHGGEVKLESEVGRGSTFVLRFPTGSAPEGRGDTGDSGEASWQEKTA